VVLEAFVAALDEVEQGELRQVLERLCTLYALSSIEADSGWFQAHNRMSATRAKTVTAQINKLCGELRPHALELVEGLGVPEAWLGSAMLLEPEVWTPGEAG
jgi:acyl-CoA oxidase